MLAARTGARSVQGWGTEATGWNRAADKISDFALKITKSRASYPNRYPRQRKAVIVTQSWPLLMHATQVAAAVKTQRAATAARDVPLNAKRISTASSDPLPLLWHLTRAGVRAYPQCHLNLQRLAPREMHLVDLLGGVALGCEVGLDSLVHHGNERDGIA
jgi:hypothetical protein